MKLPNLIFCMALTSASVWAESPTPPPTPAPEVESITPNFKKRLSSTNFAEVENAAHELVERNDPDAPALFGALYGKGDAQRRFLAIHSIGQLGLKGQETALFRVALGDLYQTIRMEAVDALGKINTPDKAVAPFITATKDTKNFSPVERYRALIAVSRLGGAGANTCLREWLKGKEPDMAVAAADGLALTGDFEQADALIAQLNSKDNELRPAAKDALERLAGKPLGYDMLRWAAWQKEQHEKKKDDDSSPSEGLTTKYNPYSCPIEETAIDLVIVYDTTGSMGKVWPFLRKAMAPALDELIKHTPSLRMGTIKYRASDPNKTMTYMISPKALTRDFDSLEKDLRETGFGGGSGGLDLGLKHALSAMTWRANARKIILLVGDCSPDNDINWCLRMAAEGWQMDHIIVNTIFVKTMHGPEHRPTFKDLAEAGVGRFYEYTGAEPHLVDMLAEKPDVNKPEDAKEIASKLCTPRTPPVTEAKKEIPVEPRPPPPPEKGADD